MLPNFNVHFGPSENIEEVDIASADLYGIDSLAGPHLKKISISGPKNLKSLCVFLETSKKLPQLEKVTLQNAEIRGLLGSQDCGGNDLVTKLVPLDQLPKSVDVKRFI